LEKELFIRDQVKLSMKKISIDENAKVHYESENYFELIIKEDSLSTWVYCFQDGALIKKYRSSEVGATLEKINGVPVVDEIVYRVSIKK
jgi:hypothetical protein